MHREEDYPLEPVVRDRPHLYSVAIGERASSLLNKIDMWKIWIIFSVFKLSYSAPVDSKEDPTSTATTAADSQALSCLFTTSSLNLCDDIKRYGNKIPKRLQKLYLSMRDSIAEGSQDFVLDSNSMHMLPATLLYVIPRLRLHNMTGLAAASILRRTPDDEALAIKLTSLLNDDAERRAFMEALPYDGDPENDEPGVHLSVGVEKELGRSMGFWYPSGKDWQYWQFTVSLTAGTPVLAHLPTHFINRITPHVAEKFLFNLRSWRLEYPNTTEIWSQHPQHIKRIWTKTALEKWERPLLWFPVVARDASYIFSGATPDEIHTIASFIRDPIHVPLLLGVDFAPLQARALIDVIENTHPDFSNVKSVKKFLPSLLPRQIQPFDPTTTDVFRYLPKGVSASLPTQKQILEHHLAHLSNGKLLPSLQVSTSWKDDISRLEHLVHLLPASSLEVFKDEELSLPTLSKISSKSLSFRQARYLTNNGLRFTLSDAESIVSSKHVLKALPASELVLHHGRSIPERVQRHLLRYIPAQSTALTAQLLDRVQLDIDDRSLLVSVLENEDHKSILELLSGRNILTRVHNFVESLTAIASEYEHLKPKIRDLPPNVGHILLSQFRKDIASSEDGWTLNNLVLNEKVPLLRLLLSNLQCADIDLINDVDVVPVLGYYVRERKDLGLAFPKNMQYCCQKALTRYLKLKSSLRHITDESYGLLNLMEGFEVKAVGGYILSSLPVDAIAPSFLKIQMIREIGALALPEQLSATSLGNLHTFADAFAAMIPELHLREVLDLGDLIWYLSPEYVRKLPMDAFELMLESKDSHVPKAPCLTLAERELWREYLVQVVGKPASWTAGTLAMLGDLLYVFDEADLDLVSASARVEAADVMSNYTSFYHIMEWPGKLNPITYYEACLEALPDADRISYKTGVHSVLRFYLESSQMLLNTVLPASYLLKIDEQINAIDGDLVAKSTESQHEPSITTEKGTPLSTSTEPLKINLKTVHEIKNAVSSETTAAPRSVGSRIKRALPKRKISKRLLSEDEIRRHDLIANSSRALVMVETDVNTTGVHVSETFPRKNMQISCDAIRMLGVSSSIVLDEVDVQSWSTDELEDCAEVLGSLNLSTNVKKSIWSRLGRWKEVQNLMEVGSLVSVIEEEDIMRLNLDITKPWALETLSVLSKHVKSSDSLDLIRDRFILGNQGLASLSFGTAAALGRIVCQMTKVKQHKLFLSQPGVFVQTAPIISASVNDDCYCIDHLMSLAKTAFGRPESWTAEDVTSMGVIAAGLTIADWKNPGLKPEALTGLTPAAVSHIPPEVFKELSEDQLSRLAPLSVAAISPAQSSSLSPSQSAVLERVRRQIPDKDLRMRGNGSSNLSPSWTALIVVLAAVVRHLI